MNLNNIKIEIRRKIISDVASHMNDVLKHFDQETVERIMNHLKIDKREMGKNLYYQTLFQVCNNMISKIPPDVIKTYIIADRLSSLFTNKKLGENADDNI